jgi:hypothetical protein
LCRQALGKDFCHSVLFEICANNGALQVAKIFAFACRVRPNCWRFFVKSPTQKLNLLTFAKTLVTRERQQFLRAHGFQGESLGPFSWFVLCRMTKNEHQCE